jgi:hypothetical protein
MRFTWRLWFQGKARWRSINIGIDWHRHRFTVTFHSLFAVNKAPIQHIYGFCKSSWEQLQLMVCFTSCLTRQTPYITLQMISCLQIENSYIVESQDVRNMMMIEYIFQWYYCDMYEFCNKVMYLRIMKRFGCLSHDITITFNHNSIIDRLHAFK